MGVVGPVEKQLGDSLSSCSSSSSLFSPMCSPRVVNRAIYSIHAIEGYVYLGVDIEKERG